MPTVNVYIAERDERRIWANGDASVNEVIQRLVRWYADNPKGDRQEDAIRRGGKLMDEPVRVP